ncbi:hypothetical protein [Nocardia terpenica]|uniref:Uncharacterized protein n=1 Tax=Nocardia terpenica TaxID=455432 RepID=A0A6G9YZL4_9NOCA|nr:hypothetical protein [Nocardia terpenica]QIS18557.1 hypothetical protein F6W96_09890 [Nocardia terpenica]
MLASFVNDLRRIPELFRQLEITITRTDSVRTQRDPGARISGDKRPMIVNLRASDRRQHLLRTLRQAAARPPFAARALSPAAAAAAILADLPITACGTGAAEWIERVQSAITKAWGVVDAPAHRVFGGRCTNCGTPVSAPAHLAVVECPRCGAPHDVDQNRDWMRRAAAEYTGTAVELARLLPELYGAHVQAGTIRKWHERGQLVGCAEDCGTTFRLGDVVALHARKRAGPACGAQSSLRHTRGAEGS